MKSYLKGIATGLIIALVVAIIPAFAANWTSINVVLNPFRVRTIMGDVIQWGDTYTLNNGTETSFCRSRYTIKTIL